MTRKPLTLANQRLLNLVVIASEPLWRNPDFGAWIRISMYLAPSRIHDIALAPIFDMVAIHGRRLMGTSTQMMLDSSKEYTMLKLNAAAGLILSALIATSAVAAGQQDASSGSPTREQVRAEVLAARAAGTLDITEANYPHEFTAEKSTATRAQVEAEVIRARAAGELDLPEGTYPDVHTQEISHVTRAEVLAEAIRARDAGELEITEAM
jgi:hypothetical protein